MKLDINAIPQEIKEGKKTMQEAVNQLSVFVVQNPSVFGFPKEDDDLISEVVMQLLEKGTNSFQHYNPEYGSFFTYFFCYIKSLMLSCNRKRVSQYNEESHYVNECILNYYNHSSSYNNIDYNEFNKPKVPYKAKTIPVEAFQLACKSDLYRINRLKNCSRNKSKDFKQDLESSTKIERVILILALKSSYYITDEQIQKISDLCGINENFLRDAIHVLNQDLSGKAERHFTLVNRRNRAYFLKKKYETELNKLKRKEFDISDYSREKINKKYENQSLHLEMFNELLQNGVRNIRPTNKAVADIMGLCERQISYYLRKAKSLTEEE